MKIGDKVRIKSLEEVLEIEGVEDYDDVENPWITRFMIKGFGKDGFIHLCTEDGYYFVVSDEGAWCFKKEWLEEIKSTTHETNSDRHRDLVNHIHDVYVDKNTKYGDAFSETIEKYGMIAALTRMNDKFNRIEQFIVNGFEDSEESLKDSLLDLANYCLMTVMEIDKGE